MHLKIDRIMKYLSSDIEDIVNKSGIFSRVFCRIKTLSSIQKKIVTKKYIENGRKIQDPIGIRVALYFLDDINIIISILKERFKLIDESIDYPETNKFNPERVNLVFEIPDSLTSEFLSAIQYNEYHTSIDSTFEIQIRTVLSEGWHEIEHDLRYKCQEMWQEHDDLSRLLNGIYASLLCSEWSMDRIFKELSYRSYKNKEWSLMLRNKLRLRISNYEIDNNIVKILNDNNETAKSIFQFSRYNLVNILTRSNIDFPLTMNNFVFLINQLYVHDAKITSLTPSCLISEFRNISA